MQPVPAEGVAALDAIMVNAAPKLSETWSGDEELVGMVVEQPGGFAIVWAARDKVLADLTKRGVAEKKPARRERYDRATAALTGPRSRGKVSVLVAGWGDMVPIEVEAEDLRMGKQFTSWGGGSA